VGDRNIGWVLGENDMLQYTTLVHNLLHKMPRGNLDWQRDWWFMIGAHHPDCGGTLDHLNLFSKLEADRLSLVDMEVNSVLASVVRLPCLAAVVAHGNSHPMVGVTGSGSGPISWGCDDHWEPSLVLVIDWGVVGHPIWALPAHIGWGCWVAW
jgi:hypothetical protein